MRVLVFGKGGISGGIRDALVADDVTELSADDCDVRHLLEVEQAVARHRPDWIVNCAGVDDETDAHNTYMTNLLGSHHVLMASQGCPTVLIASVAGLYGKPDHPAYCASKAGVIALAQSYGFRQPCWAVSPGRVDTPMREARYPDDTRGSRLYPKQVGFMVRRIMRGQYESGTNVVIRKVGLSDVFVTEHKGDGWKETLRVGRPKDI